MDGKLGTRPLTLISMRRQCADLHTWRPLFVRRVQTAVHILTENPAKDLQCITMWNKRCSCTIYTRILGESGIKFRRFTSGKE